MNALERLERANDAYERGYAAGLKVGNRNADELLADRNRIARDQADVRDMADLAKRDEQAARDDAHDAREERDALRRALGDLIDSVMGEFVELDLEDVAGPVAAARREVARLRLSRDRADVALRDAAKTRKRLSDDELAEAANAVLKACSMADRTLGEAPKSALKQLIDHINALRHGSASLGRILVGHQQDVLAAIGGAPDLINDDGDGDWMCVWERLAELRPARDAALAKVTELTDQRDRARDIAVALEQELAELAGETVGYLVVERYENSTLMDIIDDDGDGSSVRPMSAPPAFTEVPEYSMVVALVVQP